MCVWGLWEVFSECALLPGRTFTTYKNVALLKKVLSCDTSPRIVCCSVYLFANCTRFLASCILQQPKTYMSHMAAYLWFTWTWDLHFLFLLLLKSMVLVLSFLTLLRLIACIELSQMQQCYSHWFIASLIKLVVLYMNFNCESWSPL